METDFSSPNQSEHNITMEYFLVACHLDMAGGHAREQKVAIDFRVSIHWE